MLNNRLHSLAQILATPWYWLVILLGALTLEGVALFYQHVLNEPPCVLCIHARLWTFAVVLSASLGLVLYRSWRGRLASQVMLLLSLAGLLERSYRALQVEQGTYQGACGFDAGFPAWLPLDQWFPNLFEVWALCGYSPLMMFGWSMVEILTYGTLLAFTAVSLLSVALVLNRHD